MENLVTGCSDCPFRITDLMGYYECNHPSGKKVIIKKENKPDGEFVTPNDCPLNSEPITIIKSSTKNSSILEHK